MASYDLHLYRFLQHFLAENCRCPPLLLLARNGIHSALGNTRKLFDAADWVNFLRQTFFCLSRIPTWSNWNRNMQNLFKFPSYIQFVFFMVVVRANLIIMFGAAKF